MAGIDLSSILEDADDVSDQADATADAVSGAASAIGANGQALTKSYQVSSARAQATADATNVVSSTLNTGKAVAQAALRSFAASAGGGDDSNSIDLQATLAQNYLGATGQAAQALATITQKRSVSFFDDPLSWISNKLTINTDIDNYNDYSQQAEDAKNKIASINSLVDDRAVALNNQAATTSLAAAQAATTVSVNAAMEQKDNLDRQGIVANTQTAQELARLSYEQLQVKSAAFDTQAKYVQLQDSQAQLAIAQGNAELERERFALMKHKDEEQNAGNAYTATLINKGLQTMFPTNPAAWNVPQARLTAFLTKQTSDPILSRALGVGEINKDQIDPTTGQNQTGATRILATSPADALVALQYNPTLSPDTSGTVALLNQAKNLVDTQRAGQVPPKPGTPEVQEYNDKINQAAKSLLMASANHTADPTSLYYLPPADKIVSMIPGLADSPLNKEVIQPMAAAGGDLSNPAAVLQFALKASQQPGSDLSLNQTAADISTMYKTAQLANLSSKNVFNLGLVPKVSYMSKAPSLLAGKLDYTDTKAVTSYMMIQAGKDQFTNALSAAGSGMQGP